jgi:hypothetical protein
MACGYWKAGVADREAVFHLFYRTNPFGGGFAISCGQGYVRELLSTMHFEDGDLTYLATLRGNDDRPLFDEGFLRDLNTIDRVRERANAGVSALHRGIRRFLNPHEYPVGLERGLHDRRAELILETREGRP